MKSYIRPSSAIVSFAFLEVYLNFASMKIKYTFYIFHCTLKSGRTLAFGTDLKDKELLKTKVGMMNRHNVVPNSQNVQDACDAPQVGINGFSEEKENKAPIKAGMVALFLVTANDVDFGNLYF